MKIINPKLQKKYLNNPSFCPFCKAPGEFDLNYEDFDINADTIAKREVYCHNCEQHFEETFTLTSIKFIE